MRINPIYKIELKTSMRNRKIPVILFIYNSLLALIGLFFFYLNFEDVKRYGRIDYSGFLMIYTVIAVIEVGLILFIIPGFTASAIAGERERQTLDTLLSTNITPLQIILGKLYSSVSALLLMCFSSLPTMAVIFAVGGIRIVDLIQLLFLICTTAVFIGSIGLLISVLWRNTTRAIIITYGLVFLLLFGTIIIVFGGNIAFQLAAGNEAESAGKGIGSLILILLANPMVTLVSMITNQFGSRGEFVFFMESVSITNGWILNHWFITSIFVQLLCSIACLWAASKFLKPLRKLRKK